MFVILLIFKVMFCHNIDSISEIWVCMNIYWITRIVYKYLEYHISYVSNYECLKIVNILWFIIFSRNLVLYIIHITLFICQNVYICYIIDIFVIYIIRNSISKYCNILYFDGNKINMNELRRTRQINIYIYCTRGVNFVWY